MFATALAFQLQLPPDSTVMKIIRRTQLKAGVYEFASEWLLSADY